MNLDISFAIDTLIQIIPGIPVTLGMALGALLIAIPFGFLLALVRVNQIVIVDKIAALYVSFIRGTPIVVQIFLIYSILPALLNQLVEKNNWQIDAYGVSPVIYAILIFGFNTSTHLSEIFRSALLSVPKGQKEAAYTVGLNAFQTYRRIIIPQALSVAAPSMCTASMNMLKNTSLAYMMSVMDITGRAKALAGVGYQYLEAYLDIFIMYLVLCLCIEKLFQAWEKKLLRYKVSA